VGRAAGNCVEDPPELRLATAARTRRRAAANAWARYSLRVEPNELDVDHFRERLDAGRRAQAAGDAERASALLREALSLSRGRPLADFAFDSFAAEEIRRLGELQLGAVIEWVDAELALGRHDDLIGELEALVAEHPLQERLRGQLMIALYRSGRQAEALQVYQDARRTLVEELGIEPGDALRRLEQSILAHDPAIELRTRPPTHPSPVSSPLTRRRSRAVLRDQRVFGALVGAAGVVGVAAVVLFFSSGHARSLTVAGNSLAIIDPGSNRVTGQVAVGAMPAALAVGQGSLWAANRVDQTVSRIDPGSRQVIRSIAVGGTPLALAVQKNAVWSSCAGLTAIRSSRGSTHASTS
jgi:YVTN family beta-propeller protein